MDNLTAEQQKEILKARGKAQAKGIKNWNQKKNDENDKSMKKKRPTPTRAKIGNANVG